MAILDANTIAVLGALLTAVIAGVLYTVLQFFAADPTLQKPVDWEMLAANAFFGLCAGIFGWLSGIDVTSQWIIVQIGAYGVFILLLDKIIAGIVNRTVNKPKFAFYKKDGTLLKNMTALVAGVIRKMDPESRQYLVFDLPQWAQQLTLNCVDQAEAANAGAGTWQYAIQSANYVFLIEGGELTGACHFWTMFGWLGSSNVTWKPISNDCLSAIRKTCYFPPYNNLY